MLLAFAMSPSLQAQTGNFSQQLIPSEFAAFSCVEQTQSNQYRTIKSVESAQVQTVVIQEWVINELISSTKFQVTSAKYEGDMLLVIEGHEITHNMGVNFEKIKFKMATTVGENHSTLELPRPGNFSCSF